MKCLSLWEPWATLMALGLKKIETRHWFTCYRGPLLIHAAKKRDRFQLGLFSIEPFKHALTAAGIQKIDDLSFGKIVCKLELEDCALIGENKIYDHSRNRQIMNLPDEPERSFGNYESGRYAWITDKLLRFESPIDFKGMQGLFNVPDEIVAEQLSKAVPA